MYSLLVASRQLYGDFVVELLAQLLNPTGTQAKQQEPMKIRLAAETTLGLAAWMSTLLGVLLTWAVLSVLLLILLVALLHRPLPPYIADRKKIKIVEFMMRISNEYLGNLVEWLAGPVARNKLTRFLSALPFWLLRRRPPKWCQIRWVSIAGVRCRLYLPQGSARRTNACLLYIHGGGWSMGRPMFYDGPLLRLVKRLGLTVVSLDYSLSPECQFPTALLECEKVLQALYSEKFAEFGIDPNRIALMGDSAGGNLCAVLCQRALRTGNRSMIKCQILVYPVIHMLDFQSSSYQFFYRSYSGTGLLNPKMLTRWYLFYLGIHPTRANIRAMAANRHLSRQILEDQKLMELIDASQLPPGLPGSEKGEQKGKTNGKAIGCTNGIWRSHKIAPATNTTPDEQLSAKLEPLLRNPDLCPVLANDLEGLCPALICTAGIDILRDEGIHYARRLRQFNVPTEWKHYEAAYHGILNMGKSAQRAQILDDIADYLQRNLLQ